MQKKLYAAVTHFDDGIEVLVNGDLLSLLSDLCNVIHDGQDRFHFGEVTDPDFREKVPGIVERMETYGLAFDEVASMIKPTNYSYEASESLTTGDE